MSGSVDLNSRVVGCLLGGAMGDAWGGPWEGKPGPISFHVPERPVLSDDTELTLATCEAIIESGCVEPATLAAHFVRWFRLDASTAWAQARSKPCEISPRERTGPWLEREGNM